MKIFIDTADLNEIKQAQAAGLLDGVTTNPSLMKKAVDKLKSEGHDIDLEGYITEILKVAKGTPVSLEVIGTTYEEMVEEGKKLFKHFNKVADNVIIKIPINPAFELGSDKQFDGIKAIKALADDNIPINCTLVFTPEQALLAAKAGATFVSPFAGRIDDFLRTKKNMKFEKTDYYPAEGLEKLDDNGIISGVDLVAQCADILEHYGYKTEVLAASIRNARQARESALAGAHIATLPFPVIKELADHHKTAEGMKKFTEDVVPEYADIVRKG